MLQHCIYRVCLLALLGSLSVSVFAADQARYVSDRMTLPLRSDKSEKARITNKSLVIGSPVKVLREDTASGFSLVDAGNGTQGWIQSRYLTREPTALAKLVALEKKPALANDSTSLKEISSLKEENKKLLDQNRTAQQQLEDIHQASGNVVKLMEQNRDLIEKNQLLQSKVDTLEAVKEKFRDSNSMDQFIYGGILVIATLVVSAIIEGWRRRRSFSTWG
jgi:SH3 domain protein